MAQTQNTNLIRIDTLMNELDPPTAEDGDDPLLLTKVTGSEAMSTPFTFEVTMVRPLDRDRRIPLEPAKLINTVARIGIGLEPPPDVIHEATPQRWILRGGVFQSIESLGIATLQRVRHYRVYRATVVPPFAMMQREVAFRIFENANPSSIIHDMLASFPNMEINDDIMADTVFPDLTYCVQFQEDSFQFVSRLMARFGIWYFFEHPVQSAAQLQSDLQRKTPLRCSKMVLGGPSKAFLKSAFKPTAWFPEPTIIPKASPTESEIASFIVQAQPSSQFYRVGDFNQLAPTPTPAHGETPVSSDFDLLTPKFDAKGDADGVKTRFQQTAFPVPERDNKDAKNRSDIIMDAQEAGVTIVTGATRNRSFAVGSQFTVKADEDDPDEVHRRFTLIHLNIAGYDHTIGANVGTGLAVFAFDWILDPLADVANGIISFFTSLFGHQETKVVPSAHDPNPEFLLTMAGAGLNNIVKNRLQAAFQPTKPGSQTATNPAGTSSQAANFSDETYFGAGALAQIASFTPYLFKLLTGAFSHLSEQISGVDCTVNFSAIPSNAPSVPLPGIDRTLARGPHLATVIGPEGALKDDRTHRTGIYHDALGRVRVRFPWDRGPPDANDAAGKVAPPARTRDPLTTADNTCWVRSAQGWAGRGHGVQFLPRIGEEVIVDFIDGDPERPIIVGRLFNADESYANLPFPADDKDKDPQQVKIPPDYLQNAKPPTTHGFTRSGIKTGTLRGGEEVPKRFHLLRFDDDAAHEQVLLRSQGRLDITSYFARYESIHLDRHLTVGGKDMKATPPQIAGDYVAHVFRNYHLHVGDVEFRDQSGTRVTLIEQNDELQVNKDASQLIGGNWSSDVGAQMTVNALGLGGTIMLNASTNITLQVGASMIVVTPAGIFLQAPTINLAGPVFGAPVVGPPAPAIPAVPVPPFVDRPQDPTPADPGDTRASTE